MPSINFRDAGRAARNVTFDELPRSRRLRAAFAVGVVSGAILLGFGRGSLGVTALGAGTMTAIPLLFFAKRIIEGLAAGYQNIATQLDNRARGPGRDDPEQGIQLSNVPGRLEERTNTLITMPPQAYLPRSGTSPPRTLPPLSSGALPALEQGTLPRTLPPLSSGALPALEQGTPPRTLPRTR
jgi:hypothetical protein